MNGAVGEGLYFKEAWGFTLWIGVLGLERSKETVLLLLSTRKHRVGSCMQLVDVNCVGSWTRLVDKGLSLTGLKSHS